MSVKIKIETPGGPDTALAQVLGEALEKTYKILPEGESKKMAAALDKFERDFEKPAPELTSAQVAALAIGDRMKGMVQADKTESAPSKVAHVADIEIKADVARSV
jgi:hypothetical protein